eukprot:TRINITY_DN117989_c0_g1_i1.p1 TRINITY_DN117989_c0_g1~~TRINITY_DN117989_c0_g1_i1.p1  ORF type:complete len:154 (-),score=27.10 TRINITY_DN117989_c0_g1_i1:10-441(-)
MDQAPLNVRMQLAGLKLLTLWAQMKVTDPKEYAASEAESKDPDQLSDVSGILEELPETPQVVDLIDLITQAKPMNVIDTLLLNLQKSGLVHAHAWMIAIASRLKQILERASGSRRNSKSEFSKESGYGSSKGSKPQPRRTSKK